MKKTKKQLLGLAGLAAVGIMTAIAYGMPAPDASAAEQDTTVKVQISEGAPSNIFASPRDGSETANSKVIVVTNYSQAKQLNFSLSYKDQDGNTQTVVLPSYTPTDDAGTYSFELDVAPYGFGEFAIHTGVVGYDNVTRDTDTVTFTYNAAVVNPEPGKTENGDTVIDIEFSQDTERIVLAIFDKNGNPLKDKNGNPVTINLDRSDIDPATGKVSVTIPFSEYGAKAGTYTGVVSAYDKNDNLLSMFTFEIVYAPVTPDTPNTGMLSIGDLNISRVDYLITGVIAFVVAAGAAFLLISRRSRR